MSNHQYLFVCTYKTTGDLSEMEADLQATSLNAKYIQIVLMPDNKVCVEFTSALTTSEMRTLTKCLGNQTLRHHEAM